MLDVKFWLEQAGEPVAETCFPPGEVQPPPYIVFLDHAEHRGADLKNLLVDHSMTVERYSATDSDNTELETLFERIPYTKDKQWVSDIEQFMTVYNLEFTEKI